MIFPVSPSVSQCLEILKRAPKLMLRNEGGLNGKTLSIHALVKLELLIFFFNVSSLLEFCFTGCF